VPGRRLRWWSGWGPHLYIENRASERWNGEAEGDGTKRAFGECRRPADLDPSQSHVALRVESDSTSRLSP
jgi:hypothetical protein